MKKFFLFFLFLLIVIFAGLGFFVIRSFNASSFQKQISERISQMTDREFNVLGSTEVAFLPSPRIILNDVTLSNTKGSTRSIMFRAPKIFIQLQWASLLKSPLVIDRISVEDPILFLERTSQKDVNWNFPFLSQNNQRLDNSTLMNLDSHLIQTRVDDLHIKNGTIEYTNTFIGSQIEIKNINGQLTLDSLHGPYHYDGSFLTMEKEFNAKLNVQQLLLDQPVPFSLVINDSKKEISLDLNGEILSTQSSGSKIVSNGAFTIQKPNSVLGLLGFNTLSDALNVPSQGNLTYESNDGVDNLKSLTVIFGNTDDSVALTGSATREKINDTLFYTASFNINHLNLDDWKNITSIANKENLTNSEKPNFDLTIAAQTLSLGNNSAKDVSFSLSKKGGNFSVKDLKAILPGDTTISLNGGSLLQNEKLALSFLIEGSSENFDKLLDSFQNKNSKYFQSLQNVQFKTNVTLFDDRTDFDIHSFKSNQSSAMGKIQYSTVSNKPKIDLNLSINNVNFDQFTNYQSPEKSSNFSHSLALIKTYFERATFLKGFDSVFSLDLKDVTVFNLPIGHGSLSGMLQNGALKIKELSTVDMATSSLISSADFEAVGTPAFKINNLNIIFDSQQLKLFLDRAKLKAENAFLTKTNSIYLDLAVSENQNQWVGKISTKIGDLDTHFEGTLFTQDAVPSLSDVEYSITYPRYSKFIKEVMDLKSINHAIDGELQAKGYVSGPFNDLKLTALNLVIGDTTLIVDGNIRTNNLKKFADLQISTPSFDVNKFILNEFIDITSHGKKGDKIFNFSALDDWESNIKLSTNQLLWNNDEFLDAIVNLAIKDKTIELSEFSARLNDDGASIKAFGSLSWLTIPALKGNIEISGLELDNNIISGNKVSFGSGLATLSADISTIGKTPNEMRRTVQGKGKLDISNSVFVGADIPKITPFISKAIKERTPKSEIDTEFNRLLSSGKTSFEMISGEFTISDGVLKMMDTSLKADGFYSNPMQIIYYILDQKIDVSVPISLNTYADLPPFAISLKGSFDQPIYQTNFVDLSNSISDIIAEGNAKIAQKMKEQQEELKKINLSERQEKAREAIHSARNAVKNAEEKLFAGDNQSAEYLLQAGRDALSIVNTLSIKENLTDAEYIQLMEQSRLAILKSQEAVDEAVRDRYFEDRKQVAAFANQSKEMLAQIKRLHQSNPEIEVVQKLIPPVQKYTDLLDKMNNEFSDNISEDEHAILMENARNAFRQVSKAYKYVSRFETDEKIIIKPISVKSVPNNDTFQRDDLIHEPAETPSQFKGTIQRM